MFNENELKALIEDARQKGQDGPIWPDPTWSPILRKLLELQGDRYEVLIKCHQCSESLSWELFEENRRCRFCMQKICNSCYGDYPFCDEECEFQFHREEAIDYIEVLWDH